MATQKAEALKVPNRLLAWHRMERGWGHEQLVKQITRAMARDGEKPTGLSRETVRRWESGERRPSSIYRPYLVAIFGLTASQLGLLTAEDMTLRPSAESEILAEDGGVLARVVAATVKQVLQVVQGNENVVRRRVDVAGLLDQLSTLTARGTSRPAGYTTSASLDSRSVDNITAVASAQRDLYFTTEPTVLLDAVLPQLRIGVNLLSGANSGSLQYRKLATAVAHSALLAARLSFFDLGDDLLARDCFALAGHAVDASHDHALSVSVNAHRAFVPGFAGNMAEARGYLSASQAHLRQAPGPRMRAWVNCVFAELEARKGDVDIAIGHIRRAEDALDTQGVDPVWLDFFDESRLAAFAGQTYLLAEKPDLAVPYLHQALDSLAPEASKQRPVIQLDLAAALAFNDADHAAAVAFQALEALAKSPYAAAWSRLPAVGLALQSTSHADGLRDRLRALPAAPQP